MMKRKILTASGLCLTIALTALCACNSDNGKALKPDEFYGIGAVSTVKLLGSNMSARALQKLSLTASEEATGNEDEVKAQAQKFNEYFTALDSFMGEDLVTTVSEKNTDENYPYETKLTINGRNIEGEAVQYVMYYTETFAGAETDDNETESSYTLKGVMVIDGADYSLEGGRTYEQDYGETENEIKIRAYADVNDKSSYVEMKHEHSVETDETETEYVYSIYSQGQLVEQTAVEFETENKNNKQETEYELEFLKGGAKGKYVVERETENGAVQIKVKYNIGGKQGKFKILSTDDNKYSYYFDDGTVVTF